jgi:hypothetical protein
MPVFLCDQLKECGAIRVELLKTVSNGNKKFLMWVNEADEQSMVHEFSTLLSIDTFSATVDPEEDKEKTPCTTILLTRLDDEDTSTLESVSVGCLSFELATQLKDFIKGYVTNAK